MLEAPPQPRARSSSRDRSRLRGARWYDAYVVELTKLIVKIRGKLSKLERKVIVALVTTDVHARDIIDELYENKAT